MLCSDAETFHPLGRPQRVRLIFRKRDKIGPLVRPQPLTRHFIEDVMAQDGINRRRVGLPQDERFDHCLFLMCHFNNLPYRSVYLIVPTDDPPMDDPAHTTRAPNFTFTLIVSIALC